MPIPTILRGDDTELRGTTITITLPEADFTGLRVVWQFCGITRSWDAPASGATLAIDLSSDETARLPLGTHMATISVLNRDHVGYVVTNTLRIRVTDDVADATGVDNAIVIGVVEVARGLDLDGIDADPTTPNALKAAFAELLSRLRAVASLVAIVFLGCGAALADGLTLTKVPSGSLPYDAPVVTDATYTPPPETDPTVPEWAKSPTPPLTQEVDPTVPAWAKSPIPPVTEETDPLFAQWAATNIPPAAPVTSVNGKTGEVVLAAADVGAISTSGGSVNGTLTVGRLHVADGVGRTEYDHNMIRVYVPRANYYVTWFFPASGGIFSRLEDLAPEFDPAVQYQVGDLVVYSDYCQLFRCTVAHLGEWDDGHFAGVTVVDAIPNAVSNIVTKAFVEGLGIAGGSADGETITNIVRGVASSATNYTDAVKEAIITNSIDAVTLTAFRLIVADLWRRVDTLEGADGSGYITAAQASALVDEAVADAVSLAGVTNNAPFVPIAGSYTMTTCTASPATVNLALVPNREHIVRYSGSGSSSSLSIDSLSCAAVGLPALLTISNFSVVSWPANATVSGTFSALNNNTYRVTKTSRGILCEKIQ